MNEDNINIDAIQAEFKERFKDQFEILSFEAKHDTIFARLKVKDDAESLLFFKHVSYVDFPKKEIQVMMFPNDFECHRLSIIK
jgi:hypothetical protein